MARPTIIDDAQILRAAKEVFLRKGIRATTAEVARHAGVAEGSIFKRWPTKQDLFRAAMTQLESPEWIEMLGKKAAQGDPQRTLCEVGLKALEFFQHIMPLVMMSWSNRPTKHPIPRHLEGPNSPPMRALRRIAAFFEGEIRAGRIRRHDPEILARAFLGGIQNYVFGELLQQSLHDRPIPPETYIRGLVKLLWSGAEPRSRKETL
jgi:AcrR family transcriptional regulator